MAVISAFTLIRAVSLFHLTAAYFFLTAPWLMADQNIVFILGQSQKLPHANMDTRSESSAFIAVLLTVLALSDFTAASLDRDVSLQYWLANVPVRLAFLFALTGSIFLFKDDGVFGGGRAPGAHRDSPGASLRNSLVFTWGFVETAAWFWVFMNLREEREMAARRRLVRLKAEEDRL